MIADGHTSQSIASNLGISVRTVEGYRAQLMEKLQVTSIAAIVRMAIRLGRISA
jgi:DNA-binding CsgD family transcriptional regulator